MSQQRNDITQLLAAMEGGDPTAAEELLPLIYNELRRVAAAKMAREPAGHTLQATALVHEAWLRLGTGEQQWNDRAHFFGSAAEAMRRILIERARRKSAVRRGSGQAHLDIADIEVAVPTKDEELLAVHSALDELAAHAPREAELVKLRYFVGLTIDEAAEILGVSPATANRDWDYARAWLFRKIKEA